MQLRQYYNTQRRSYYIIYQSTITPRTVGELLHCSEILKYYFTFILKTNHFLISTFWSRKCSNADNPDETTSEKSIVN